MTIAEQLKQLERLQKREEREARRVQKELARRARERQKLSELEAARLEVETFENELEVILSIHKEVPEALDWAGFAFALPPPAPPNPGINETLHEMAAELGDWLEEPPVPDAASATAADQQAHAEAMVRHRESLVKWQELRDLGRRVMAGETSAYTKAIADYSNLAELYALGSGIHVIVHGPATVEFTVTVKGKDVIPAEVKSLTSTGKLSVRAMPRTVFMAHYQDYVCGCVLRVARELFAMLPVETILAHAAVPAFDRSSGVNREMTILSVVLERAKLAALDFDRLDPSDTLESFPHRGSAKLTRGSMDFQEIIPLGISEPGGFDASAGEEECGHLARITQAREVLRQSALKWLPREAAESIFNPPAA